MSRSAKLGVLLCGTLCGCAANETVPRTEVLLQIDADAKIRAMADLLRVEIASAPPGTKKLTPGQPELFDLKKASFHWPASIALVAAPDHTSYVFEVTITAEASAKPVARGRVRSAFLRGKTLLLSTSLFDSCIGFFECGTDETCEDQLGNAQCVNALVDPKKLPLFTPHSARDAGASTPSADGGASNDAGTIHDAGQDSGSAGGGKDAGHKDSGADASTALDAAAADSGAGAGHDAAACVPALAEDCWNGVDDDCNGDVDCADPACADPAMCAPAGQTLGVLVPDPDSCPSGFDNSVIGLHQGLSDPGCTGCSCTVTPTQCTADVYYYIGSTTAIITAACTADIAPYGGGVRVGAVTFGCCGLSTTSPPCTGQPLGESIQPPMDTPYAWRVAPMNVVSGQCTPHGTASPLGLTWSNSAKLCTTTVAGKGCSKGFVCVHKPSTGRACGEKGVTACPSGSSAETWHTGYSDARNCDSCGCTASGANCDNVQVNLGHDWTCPATPDDSLHGGQKSCSVSTYAPPAILVGTPTDAACAAAAASRGSMAPTGPIELCCAP